MSGFQDVPHQAGPGWPTDQAVPVGGWAYQHDPDDRASATRYMCAGARLDEYFAREVVRELRHERFRACAPSYGVDLDRVLGHAEEEVQHLRRRDFCVAGAFLAALVLFPLITVLYWLAMAFMPRSIALGTVPSAFQQRPAVDGTTTTAQRRDSVIVGLVKQLGIQVVLMFVLCLFGTRFLNWLGFGLWTAFVLALLLLLAVPWFFSWEQLNGAMQVLREQLTPTAFAASAGRRPTATAALPRSAVGGDANLIVYSGYRPFVGAGDEVTSWSFAMRLLPKGYQPGGSDEPARVNFQLPALVRRLAADLDQLRAESVSPADRIPGLQVTEKVFINGSELRNNSLFGMDTFWPGHIGPLPAGTRPADALSDDGVSRVRGLVDGPVRHCLCAQVRSWGSDLVLSVFAQVTVSGSTLYVQANTLVLTPVKDAYRVADSFSQVRTDEETTQAWVDALVHSRGVMLTAVFSSIGQLFAPIRLRRRERDQRRAIANDKRYDFGARLSLREVASSHAYRNFFQRMDVTRVGKQIELQILHTLANFLAEHDMDLGDLQQHREVILNNGVLMTGGVMTGSIAAGTGATATTTTGGNAGKPAGGGATGKSAER